MLSANMDDAVKQEFTKIVGELGMSATTALTFSSAPSSENEGCLSP